MIDNYFFFLSLFFNNETIINISYFYENALINRIKGLKQVNYNLKSKISSKWTGGDLNPRPPECKSGVHTN